MPELVTVTVIDAVDTYRLETTATQSQAQISFGDSVTDLTEYGKLRGEPIPLALGVPVPVVSHGYRYLEGNSGYLVREVLMHTRDHFGE